jgi:hypothetical protein
MWVTTFAGGRDMETRSVQAPVTGSLN